MRSPKVWLLSLLLLLSLGIHLGVLARHWRADRAREAAPELTQPLRAEGAPRPLLRLLAELGLEGREREAFLALQLESLNRMLEGRKEVRDLQQRLRRQILAPEPDRQAIGRTLEELSAANFRMESAFVDDLLSSREMLGPRQERLYLRFMGRVRQARIEEMQRHLRSRRAPAKPRAQPRPE